MIFEHHAGLGNLRVVDHGIDMAEGLDRLLDHVRHGSFVRAVRRNRQNLHAVFGLKLFLRGFQTAHRAAGDGQVRALFGKRFRQTEADALTAAR